MKRRGYMGFREEMSVRVVVGITMYRVKAHKSRAWMDVVNDAGYRD